MKILVVGPSWVGDMVMAQALFMALKEKHPDCQIDVLAPDWSRPILERMPEVSTALVLPFGHGVLRLKDRRQFGHRLRDRQYDRSIVLPNSLKSALIPYWAGIPVRTGWRGEMRYHLLNDLRVLNKKDYPLMIERFIALAFDKGIELPDILPFPKLTIKQESRNEALRKFSLQVNSRPVLALCPGAEFGESKKWPEAHYAKLAGARIDAGWQVWIFGSSNDVAVAESIKGSIGTEFVHDLTGRTSLAEAVDLLSVVQAVVTNDSGLMHIAAALGRPLVVAYGSTSPEFTPPLSNRVRMESLGLDCSPCFQRECPLQHGNCMKQLSVDRLDEALTDLMKEVDSNKGLGNSDHAYSDN